MKILIVEDDRDIAMLEQDYLQMSDFETEIISDGEQAQRAILDGGYDLILLDVMLPGKSGYDICRTVRELVDVPILMVTARDESADKIRGLGLGADDYIAKPFDPAELVARVRSHLSRYVRLKNVPEAKKKEDIICVGEIEIHGKSWLVRRNGTDIRLPNREFELLLFLIKHPGEVFTRDALLELLWDYSFTGETRTVDAHIRTLRMKLGEGADIIETVRGTGYKSRVK